MAGYWSAAVWPAGAIVPDRCASGTVAARCRPGPTGINRCWQVGGYFIMLEMVLWRGRFPFIFRAAAGRRTLRLREHIVAACTRGILFFCVY